MPSNCAVAGRSPRETTASAAVIGRVRHRRPGGFPRLSCVSRTYSFLAPGVLYCEVRCENLQQICAVWELLKPRAVAVQDGFAALSGPREASVQLRGAVVRLRLAPLQRLQQGLGTVSRWVEALGLLQVAGRSAAVTGDRRWPVALAVTALRLVALLAAAYLAAQYFMRYGPQRPLPAFLDQLLVLNSTAIAVKLNATVDVAPVEDWRLGALYASPYLILVALLGYDAFRCRHTWRKKPTQVIYEWYFGIQGTYYTWKVALLQLMTVTLQAAGKLKLLSAIVSVAISLEAEAALHLKMGFWFFAGLLLANGLYPGLLMLLPHSSMRFAAASIDAFLDLGYTVTYLATVLTALPALSSENSISGNFGDDNDLKISNQLPPSFAFPSDLLQYAAVYVSLAHVLAVCRALERAERDTGKRKPMRRGASMDGAGKMMLAAVLSALPLVVLACIWQGVSYPQVQPGDFQCFPCQCDATSTSTLRLLGCELPAILRYTQLSLSDHNIGQIKPNASFPASLKVLSLSSNPMRNLNGSLFAQLHSLEAR